jgi:hypothetical protein
LELSLSLEFSSHLSFIIKEGNEGNEGDEGDEGDEGVTAANVTVILGSFPSYPLQTNLSIASRYNEWPDIV